MSLLLTRLGRGRATWDRRYNPSLVIDIARAGLADMVRGAALTYSRASAAWAFDSSGVLRQYASGAPRIVPSPVGVMSVLSEPQSTNKCTNYNANPNGSLTNMAKGGDAAATLTEVDDTAALAAAGLSTVCSSGKVFKLDNSAGVAIAYVDAYGATGNTNDHALSAYMRGSGSAYLRTIFTLTNDWGPATLTSSYARIVSRQSSGLAGGSKNSVDALRIVAHPGAVVYFILNQFEEGAYETTPIVVAGSQVTRAIEVVSGTPALNSAEGTLWVDFSVPNVVQSGVFLFTVSEWANSYIALQQNSAAPAVPVRKDMVANADLYPAGTVVANARHRMAARYKAGDNAACFDGGAVTSNARADVTISPANIYLGNLDAVTNNGVKYIHGVRYFPRALSGAQLQALTS